MHSQSALSTEYVRVAISVSPAATITTDAVSFALPLTGTEPQTWLAGSWESDGTTVYARCLVGPDGEVTLVAGRLYDVWLKITDDPEQPARCTGAIYAT